MDLGRHVPEPLTFRHRSMTPSGPRIKFVQRYPFAVRLIFSNNILRQILISDKTAFVRCKTLANLLGQKKFCPRGTKIS